MEKIIKAMKLNPEKFISKDDIEKLVQAAREARTLLIVYAEKFKTNTFDEWLKRIDEALEPFSEWHY
jgi:hypothetical protein